MAEMYGTVEIYIAKKVNNISYQQEMEIGSQFYFEKKKFQTSETNHISISFS